MLIIMGVSLLITSLVVTCRMNRPTGRCALQLSKYGDLMNVKCIPFSLCPWGVVSSSLCWKSAHLSFILLMCS
jgi:hypothetical protein